MYNSKFKTSKNVKFQTRDTTRPLFYQDFILPVLKIQRALGFAPFYMDRGQVVCGFDPGATLYCMLCYSLILALTITTQLQLYKEIKTRDVTFNAALLGYLKLLAITQQLLGPLPFLLQKRNFQRFLKKWTVFQEEYQKLTGDVLRLSNAKTLRNIGISFIPPAMIIPFLRLSPNFTLSCIIHDVTFSIFFAYEICVILYWLLTSKAIRLIANQYKYNFVKEVRNGRGYSAVIEAYRLLWMNLCNITNHFASSIAATITVCLVFHVLYLILAAYRTVVSVPEYLRNEQNWNVFPIVVDLIFHLLLIFFFCNVGQNVPKYCTSDMLETILDINEQSLYRSLDQAKVNIFLYTINEYTPVVSVCGYYEINRSLFGGVVSVLLTYMIVIIQLKDSI